MKRILIPALVMTAACSASAEVLDMDGPRGIKVGQRMTIKPYVSLDYSLDSNPDSGKHSNKVSTWSINPRVGIDYKADSWSLDGDAFARYHVYNRYNGRLGNFSYGERLNFRWDNSAMDARGWSVRIGETFTKVTQDDDFTKSNGRGLWRDRNQLNVNGGVEHRFNERLHASLNASYYQMEFDNGYDKYAPLYGHRNWRAGGSIGYAFSPWVDISLRGNYTESWQDNHKSRDWWRDEPDSNPNNIGKKSKGWTVHGGIGTRATERITYSVSGGWSHHEYASVHKSDSFTYGFSGSWQMSETLHMMAHGSSNYMPSEREYGASVKYYSAGVGFGKSLVRGKLRATIDGNFRYETHDYVTYASDDYDETIWTVRGGLSYTLNRYFQVHGSLEYQTESCDGGYTSGHEYDYDRWRLRIGVGLTY